MPWKQKLTADLICALLGNAINKLFGFVIIVVLARYIDKSSMGEYFFAISVTSVVAMLTELGTSRHLVREIARDRRSAAGLLAQVLYIRLPLLVSALVLTDLCVWVFEPALLKIFLLMSAYVLINDLYFAFGATLVAVGSIVKRVATGLVGPGFLLLIVVQGANLGWSFDRILMAHATSSVIMVWVATWVTLRIVGPLPRGIDTGAVKRVLALALPFFTVSILALVHARLDEIMLAMLRSYEEVASYAASYKLLEVSKFVIRPLIMVLFPVFVAAAAAESWPDYRDNTRRLMLGVGAIGFAMLTLVVPGAYLIVPLVYGNEYQSSIPITQILFLAAPVLFVGQAAILVANALYLDRVAIVVAALGVIGNGGLNLFVIPRWGAVGAAWTTLASETFVTLGLLAAVWSCLHRKLPGARQPKVEDATGFDTGSS
jgi:O-antigen/teichoic acid export membrane protein